MSFEELGEEPPLGPMPVVDAGMVAEFEAMWADPDFLAELEAQLDSDLASMNPLDVFEWETGLPATPEHGFFPAPRTEEAAAMSQDRLTRLDRVARLADVHRIAALLDAYETTVQDLETRFSRALARRDGLGVQAFFKTVGLELQMHPTRVAHLLDTATTARDRLPATWAVYRSAQTNWRRLELAVQHLDGLDEDRVAAYDEKAAAIVQTSTRVAAELRRARERLQDDTASRRAKTAFELRNVVVEQGRDGQASLIITGPAVDIVPYADALHRAAVAAHGTDEQNRSIGALQYDIVRDCLLGTIRRAPDGTPETLTVPGRRPVDVQVILTIPALAWLGHTTEQALLAGYGPIDLDTAKGLAGTAKSMIRVLTHPLTGVRLTMDQHVYRPPVDLARWVKIRDGRSRFPADTRTAWLADIDHAREWQYHGATNDDNLISLSRPTHNAKTAGLFSPTLHPDTSVGWNDTWGHHWTDPPPEPMDPAPEHLLSDDPPF